MSKQQTPKIWIHWIKAFFYIGLACVVSVITGCGSSGTNGNQTTKDSVIYNWQETQNLAPGNTKPGDSFGRSLAIEGNYLAIGSDRVKQVGNRMRSYGSVYIFKKQKDDWVQQTRLLANDHDKKTEQNFSYSIAISGDCLIVGDPLDNSKKKWAGSAYIFRRTGDSWVQEAKIQATAPKAMAHFGESVAISGNYVVVGAPNEAGNHKQEGAVYIFKKTGDTWKQHNRFESPTKKERDNFGQSVSISGNYAAVGASEKVGKGVVYVLKKTDDAWAQETTLLPKNNTRCEMFGSSVKIDGNYIVVSDPTEDVLGIHNSGAVYVFKKEGNKWQQTTKLRATSPKSMGLFGNALDLSNGYIGIGTASEKNRTGILRIFAKQAENWTQVEKIEKETEDTYSHFGANITLSGNHIVTSNQFEKNSTGIVFVYQKRAVTSQQPF